MNTPSPIRYLIKLNNPHAHLFEIECRVPHPAPEGQQLFMPAWIPGSYMIRDFARNIVSISANSEGEPVELEKLDKQTWHCAPCSGELTLRYQVYGWDLSVRAAHFDHTHAYFNGTSVFLCPLGHEDEPCELTIEPPSYAWASGWRVATGLARLDAPAHGFGRYGAAGYDELIDCPVEIGDLEVVPFEAAGVPHEIAIYGRLHADVDLNRLVSDLTRICEHHIRFFGLPAPMERYTFLLMALGEGYGGLEHRNSSSNLCKRDDLPRMGDQSVSEGYRTLLGLLSHEYFHSWNVKRIKPAVFTPYDLSKESHTGLMWLFEGVTSYYDDLALLRTGLIDRDSYLELLGRSITRLWRGSGRLKQTIVESSFDAWTKFYKQDENAPNAIVSYYIKGALVALALDLSLRIESDSTMSLDRVMRELWRRFGQPGKGVGERDMEVLCQDLSGRDMTGFFDMALRSMDDLPLGELLSGMGIELNWRAAENQNDQGGKSTDAGAEGWLGARFDSRGAFPKLIQVFDGGPAMKAGLSAGDELVALDGLKLTGGSLETLIGRMPLAKSLPVHAFRRDELMETELILEPAPKTTAYLSVSVESALLDGWLGSSAAK